MCVCVCVCVCFAHVCECVCTRPTLRRRGDPACQTQQIHHSQHIAPAAQLPHVKGFSRPLFFPSASGKIHEPEHCLVCLQSLASSLQRQTTQCSGFEPSPNSSALSVWTKRTCFSKAAAPSSLPSWNCALDIDLALPNRFCATMSASRWAAAAAALCFDAACLHIANPLSAASR